jgi:hypothetical protein
LIACKPDGQAPTDRIGGVRASYDTLEAPGDVVPKERRSVTLYDLVDGVWAILVTTVLTAEVIIWLEVLGLAAMICIAIVVVRYLSRR